MKGGSKLDNISNGPLKGIKVLDLTRVLAGPYATMILADLGAEVIKVEKPKIGDDSRQYGPFVNSESAYFMSINRNKHSITLNLKKEEGRDIFFKLIKEVDVIVENFRPGTMKKLGLSYDTIKLVNPQIIYAAVSGFGHTGPYSERAAYDGIVQAMGGIMGITGEKMGNPTRVGASIGDIIAGMFCCTGILAAYIDVQKTGRSQFVDVAMLDSQVAILENAITRYYDSGIAPGPNGNAHPSIYPFQTFPTRTEDLMIACGNDSLWKKLCKAINLEEVAEMSVFSSNYSRGQNQEEMTKVLSERLIDKPANVWIEILDQVGVPCSLINKIDKVIANPQIQARNMIIEVEHSVSGKISMAGIPIKLEHMADHVRKAAPLLGESNKAIYGDVLGMKDKEIFALEEKDII